MDMYGVTTNDIFHVDDLLDFSNEDLFSSSTTTTTTHHESDYPPPPPLDNTISTTCFSSNTSTTIINPYTTTYTDQLSAPSELDAEELEWVSKLVDDSFTDFPVNELSGNVNLGPDVSSSVVPGKAISRSKRSRLIPAAYLSSWTSTGTSTEPVGNSSASNSSSSPTGRKCTHCQSEKTPQWRTGPMGPKTLCNACGVRYKSGRLVPEYRPAASPTFTLTHHSNSHRKVMELRRQKEVLQKDNNNLRHEYYKLKWKREHVREAIFVLSGKEGPKISTTTRTARIWKILWLILPPKGQ